MTQFVVDASVSLAWVFPDESDPYAVSTLKHARTHGVVVPAHWALEVANALAMAERKGRVTTAVSSQAILFFDNMRLETDAKTVERAFSESLVLVRRHSLTVYDAAYLELCLRRGLSLATLDERLRQACSACGVLQYQPA